MDLSLLSAIAILVVSAGYLLTCAIWPYTSCWFCTGGKHRSKSGRSWRKCWRCKGTGQRLRIGTHAIQLAGRLANKKNWTW